MNDKAERYQGDTVVFDTETLAMDKKAVVQIWVEVMVSLWVHQTLDTMHPTNKSHLHIQDNLLLNIVVMRFRT